MNRSDGASDQCASSIAIRSGCRSARFAVSQYRPCNTPNGRSRRLARRVDHRRRGQPGGARQQPLAIPALGSAQDRLEALAHDTEGVPGLEFDPTRGEHEHPGLHGASMRAGQQRRLSDPGAALDDHRDSRAFAGGYERVLDSLQLTVALQQRPGRGAMYPRGNRRVEV